MRVLVAPDKFKGTLSAQAATEAITVGLRPFPGIQIESCPIADGGEGFAEALATRFDTLHSIQDPLGRPVTSRCGWLVDDTAVIEMSDASGFHRLTPAERDPWHASTFGTGQLILHAASRGASRILVGLGGSATNDAGAGVAAALGWQFLTSDGEPIAPIPANFLAIERIEPPEDDTLPLIIAACDVRNPLLGPTGASHTYARQKGADDRMISYLELALGHLAGLIVDQLGIDHRAIPGAGAAGGLGYGLATFCSAQLKPGFAIVADSLHLEERVAAADLIITGEGSLDLQTLRGKAPAELARLAKKYDKPAVIICGHHDPAAHVAEWFDLVITLDSLDPDPACSPAHSAALVTRAAALVAKWALR